MPKTGVTAPALLPHERKRGMTEIMPRTESIMNLIFEDDFYITEAAFG